VSRPDRQSGRADPGRRLWSVGDGAMRYRPGGNRASTRSAINSATAASSPA